MNPQLKVGDKVTIKAKGHTFTGIVTMIGYQIPKDKVYSIEFETEYGLHSWKSEFDKGEIIAHTPC